MLENKKNVNKIRKIIIVLISLILLLCFGNKSIAAIQKIDLDQGTVIPEYKPIWTKLGSSLDTTNKTLTITLKGSAYQESQTIYIKEENDEGEEVERNSGVTINYASDAISTLEVGDISIYINGTDVTGQFVNKATAIDTTVPMKELKAGTVVTNEAGKEDITYEFVLYNFEEAIRQAGIPYKGLSGNVKLKIAGRGEEEETYSADVLTDIYGNHSMMETDENQSDGTWIDVTFEDDAQEENTNGKMFTDFVKPEFTYTYSITDINHTSETVTVVFDVVDQYFESTTLSSLDASQIEVLVDNYDTTELNSSITKQLTKVDDIKYTVNGVENTKVGERYQLTITNLDKNDAFKYSGYMSLSFDSGVITDKSGNTSDATTIAIGLNENDGNENPDSIHGSGTIVDVADPIWKIEDMELEENASDIKNSTLTITLVATDKYYLNNVFEEARANGTLEETLKNNILLYIDGTLDGDTDGDGVIGADETPVITKTLSTPTNLTPTGTGVKYTLTFSNWDDEKYSGIAKLKILKDTITDQYTNTSNEQEFTVGRIDFTKPVITFISSENKDTDSDGVNDSVEIVFKATDKYMYMNDLITIPDESNPSAADEITVYVDNDSTTGITRTLTSEEITEVVNGVTVKGHKYTLLLSNFEQARTTINRAREFSDWSGTVSIKIAEGAVRDEQLALDSGLVVGGNLNEEKNMTGTFADFIKPNVTYEYSSTDIVRNHEDKTQRTFTMVFDITDKYFTSSAFATALEAATTDAQKLAVLKEYLTIWVDQDDITNIDTVTKKIVGIQNVTATMNKTVGGTIISDTYTIGKRFTLEISGLEQNIETAEGEEFLDYSGVVTVAFNADKPIATDSTGNVNNSGTITVPSIISGVNTPGGTGTGTVVDLVDPIWEQVGDAEARPHDKYASVTIKGTDKYIQTNNLQPADITIIVTRPSGVTTVTGDQAEDQGMTFSVTEDTSVTLDYGKQYNIELNGYARDSYQVKIVLRDGILVDESGNTSQEKELILFTSLAETSTETELTSEFLSKNKQTGQTIPQRQYIEQVIFQDDLTGINSTKWDVSQLNDGSIWAWYTTRTADDGTTLYTVYIGSTIIINANVNSSYLFANIGHDENCKVTGDPGVANDEMIQNLYIVHLSCVTNMQSMFEGCGYANMKSLDLGDGFDTKSANNMKDMFKGCGYNTMVSIDLGDNFKTSNVQNMEGMFRECGYNAMTSLNLGTQFNTTSVTDMDEMFWDCGYEAMETLNIGTQFDTTKVTSMNNMFHNCGYKKLESLNLGLLFDTTKVTNMANMFAGCGKEQITTFDLGDKFYTTSATDMTAMFQGFAQDGLQILDLGPAFTRIADTYTDFAKDCGKSSTVIYAPESIYSSLKNFKLNTSSNTKITLDASTQGTINPVYRPEWTKVSSNLNKTTGKMTIVVNGTANKVGTPVTQINYKSDVTSTLNPNDVTVYVDGEKAEDITVETTSATEIPGTDTESGKKEVQHTIILSGFEKTLRKTGKNFREWSGNISLQFAKGTLKDMYGSSLDGDGNRVNIAGNSNLATIDIDTSGTLENIVVEDSAKLTANTDVTEANMFGDLIKPEFTYEYSDTVIGDGDHGDTKTVTVVFDVTDKYFKNTQLETDTYANLITVQVDGTTLTGDVDQDGVIDSGENIGTRLTKTGIFVMNKTTKAITSKATDYEIPTTEQKVGERYQLVITGLQQTTNDGFDFSGIVTIGFEPGIIEDLSGNKNNAKSITIGKDDPTTGDGHDSGVVVDVVDPVWLIDDSSSESGLIKLIAQDKYFETATLDEEHITVYVNGQPSEDISKNLTGPVTVENGYEYTLQLGNITVEGGGGYLEFTPTNVDELVGETAKYRIENGGDVLLGIAEDTIEDQSGNKSIETKFEIGIMDDTQPEVYDIQKIQNSEEKTETIIFNVTDKNYDPSDLVNTNEITVLLDGEETSSITKYSLTSKEIKKAMANGTTKVVGHQYTLVLKDIVETQTEFINSGREFRELSGTLEIKIAANAAKDTKQNTLNTDKTTISDFVDFIRPEVNYKYAISSQEQTPQGDINYQNKTFTMVFEILDKYIKESTLKNELDEIKTELENIVTEIESATPEEKEALIEEQEALLAEKQEVIEQFLEILIDDGEIDWTEVDKDLTVEEVNATTEFNKTVDGAIVRDTHIIGYKYTLVLSNLEQLQIKSGDKYADYSGVITTAIEAGIATDTTGKGNVATTITSGIDIVGDVQDTTDDEVIVDVVDSIWEKVSSSASAIDPDNPTSSTATITFKGTDKFFQESKITQDTIKQYVKVYAHTGNTPGTEVTDVTNSVNITIDEITDIEDTVNDVEDVVIGKQYKITITGYEQTVNQLKIEIQPGAMVDKSGNTNKATEMLVYNVLRLTNTETVETSKFLGSTDATIQRQNIENVTFLSDTTTVPATGWWDVSAAGDNSIKAWAETQANGKLKVYIASDDEIFANPDSSYLFSYIGYAEGCTAVEPVTGLSLLNETSVTNMSYMFNNFGYRAMTTLNLGDFDTRNVTNMAGMFNNCGNTVMNTLNLGTMFNTSKVTDMSNMFSGCGQNALTTLDLSATGVTFNTSSVTNMSNMFKGQSAITTFSLGSNFNTENVQNMSGMFQDFGYSLETLDLGANFNTSAVTDMSNMFNGTGKTAMTTLTLGNNFNTSAVQSMNSMFKDFATNSSTMTSLDLGEKFYTTLVTDMTDMFNGCGTTAMTSLDLGPAFTKIANTNTGFVTNTGKANAVIYAPESIYSNMKNFKLNSASTTAAIKYEIGTINDKYKPEWSKVSSSIDTEHKTIDITIKGNVNTTTYTNANTTITSNLPTGTPLTAEQAVLLNVYIDGELAEDVTKAVAVVSETETEVQYKITLSDFEKTLRKTGKNFKEWSGNIAIQPVKGTLEDYYGNQNLEMIDIEVNADGTTKTTEKIELKDDTNIKLNTDGKLFTDYIKPEFTYEYYNTEIEGDTNANTVIDYTNNKVTIVFDVTDKYFGSTTLATDTTANNITVKVDEDANANTAITKALSKKTLASDQVVGNITYKANGDIYYTVNGTSQKVGERYELVITGLESANGVGYSGPMTLTFEPRIIEDLSGNKNDGKTITIGIDEPTKHPEHDEEVVVDVVNPIWVGLRDVNSIDRSNDTVSIKILGIDKYYKTNTLTTDKITVYVDLDGDGTIEDTEIVDLDPDTDMVLEAIGTTELATLAEDTELANYDDVRVGYTLKLSGFGDISGKTKIEIDDGTIEDLSGNKNKDTDPIFAGNIIWTETDDDSTTPRYPAFRNDIVDFIDPIITYTYSTVEVDTDGDGEVDSTVSANPDIDYERKQVTVKFTVTDKYLLESDLIKTDANGNQIPKNIRIIVDGTEVYNGNSETQTTEVTTSISETAITGGKEYTLVVSNLQQTADAPENTTPANGDGFKFSGPMQLVFEAGAIDDTSGNKNPEKTISLKTHVPPNVVDVVDPIIKYVTSSIDRNGKTVTLQVKAEDKYLLTETLSGAESTVKVKVLDENGTEITEHAIINDITLDTDLSTSQSYVYNIVLSNFGVYEGKTSVIIPADVVRDSSGNKNVVTEILVGNASDTTAFKDSIVDFTIPTWEYVTSSIDRNVDANGVRTENGTVTLEVKGTDIYFDDAYFNDENLELDLSAVKVYINGTENTQVTKAFATNNDGTIKKEEFEETKELATGYSRVLKGLKYTIILGNFGTNEGTVKIEIPKDAIKDTSTNGNIETKINVGNPQWVETVGLGSETENADSPKYTAFRNNIVDYIKPVIKYQYVENTNPLINRTNETVDIIFTATDTNFLESNIGIEDFKIYIDGMQVYGQGASVATDIHAEILTPIENTENNDGLKYTLRLSSLELNGYIEDLNGNGQLDEGEDINGNGTLDTLSEMFERHSGVIKLVIAADQVADSSGNKNIETTLIVDNADGDDQANGIIVDFVNPNIYYQDKYLNWEDEYALITLRATDRFYNTDTELKESDIKLYEEVENDDGTKQYIDITERFSGKITIDESDPLKVDGNTVGYDYTIKITDFTEEFKMKIVVAAGAKDEDGNILNGIGDTSGNLNDETEIFVDLDNRRPSWKYVSTDTTNFEASGSISFNVKGVDKFLDLGLDDNGIEKSKLTKTDITVLKDGVDITNVNNITVTHTGTDEDEKSKSYKIDVTGLSGTGTYTLVLADGTLVDIFGNESAATTISFSNSAISSNTGNYVNVTYHVTPDMETEHSSYAHELISVNETGTNYNNPADSEDATYRPSSLGELFNNGENPLFAEPMYVPSVDGYTINKVYEPKSFAGWAVCDENGNVAAGATVYGLYDEIPITVTNLKAVWQEATVVFVSATEGKDNDANFDGTTPDKPVKTLEKAYEIISGNEGTVENNIIVIMDEVVYDETNSLSGNATITSIYAGTDYRKQGAELKVSSNMTIDGDIIFDNIELYVDDIDNKLISNYSGDIILGRGITTPTTSDYTFGAIIGGNFDTETSTGEHGTHTIRVEAGKYNNIIAGSSLTTGEASTDTKSITHNVVIGNMRDTAVSRNDKLTITGYVAIGENEKACYPSGATYTNNANTKNYANVTLYSGTITSSDTAIYLRSINGETDGLMNFEMFGGVVTGNVYGGSRVSTALEDTVFNTMKFYGGQITGNVFGQGLNDTFNGSSSITLQGNFKMTGNVYGGSNRTATVDGSVGKGNSTITIDSSSVTVTGNIYGGGNVTEASTGYIIGTTNITLNSGTVSNIYGSGYNCGNTGATNITIENGIVNANIFGGAYQNQARSASNITVLGGTVHGNIYGGNENIESQLDGDTFFQNVNIIIGDTDATKAPTVNGVIYGGGKYDKVDVATIELIESMNATSVFGGSQGNGVTITSDIYLKGMTVNEIYGGSNDSGSESATVSVANIYLQSGTVTDVYGGGFKSNSTQSNITLEGTATVTSIYGGPSTSGKVTTSNVTLKSGTVTNVFGGGNSAEVGTSRVTLDGITVGTIHGGSKDAGLTTTSNVILNSGRVTNVFGGGLDVGVTTSNVKQQGATVTNIYGGNNSIGTETATGGETETANVEIINATVTNIYGGNYLKGTTRYANINIHGISTVTGNIFGGGYKSDIGKSAQNGIATINIASGTIRGDINGGSEQGIVYGNTNINVGFDAIGNASLTPGAINIIGTIYGAGSTLTPGTVTVVGDTNITMDNGITYPITYYTADGKEKSIYGSGMGGGIYSNGTGIDRGTIHIKDFGTSDNIYLFKSIEDTGNLYIGNSVIELIGALDKPVIATQAGNYYTLNTITNALTIYNNTTLYTQRGFNKVGGFYSYVGQKTTRATVTIAEDGTATTNVDNRLYTLEGINLIFAKKEVTLANKATLAQTDWGEVTGMAYFGTYKNTSSGKQYDLSLFKAGTYVEGQYNSYHNVDVDGFYTTTAEGTQIINTVNYTNYCDWIINAPTINYDVDLVASTYGQNSVAEILLNYKYASDYTYAPQTVYTISRVSTNALKPGIELVDPTDSSKLPTVSANANNTFGLTMETTPSGWQEQALTNIYTASNGSFAGDSVYTSDGQAQPGSIKFKVHNSLNITEEKDLGTVTIILTAQQPISGNGIESYTFNVAIAVDLQTIVDELKTEYVPSFTDRTETELSYTTDSRVDLSYLLYNNMETTPYAADGSDYRVISTTIPLPAKTKLTLKDYGQGDGVNKVYYYQVASDTDYYETETVNGTTRYLYKLTKFTEMGSTDDSYVDSTTYYHSTGKYVLEKYDLSIDFIDANVDTKVSSDILAQAQETYLELRDSSGDVKYDNDADNNGDTTIKYYLKTGQNAVVTESITNEGTSIVGNTYSVVESIEIPITINASILQQSGVLDTKYYDQIAGIAIQIVGENNIRIKSPELQNFKLTNNATGEVYTADSNGVIRMPIIEGLGGSSNNYTLSITQANVSPGLYTAQVILYTADDGKYYGTEPEIEPLEFNITFISRLAGLLGVKTDNESSRIINKSTGLNLVEGSVTSKAIDMTVGINNPTNETNIRVELYKRNPTYTNLSDETTYTGTSYTLVDIKNYLQGEWTESVVGSKEYVISPKKTYETKVQLETLEFEKAIIEGISTGEYKLVFKAYSDNTLLQTFSKTFMVTP